MLQKVKFSETIEESSFADKVIWDALDNLNGDIVKLLNEFERSGVKVLPIQYVFAIGHLSCEIDCFVKEMVLGRLPQHTTILLAPRDQVPNMNYLTYWTKYLLIVTDPVLCKMLEPIINDLRFRIEIEHYMMTDNKAVHCYQINKLWDNRDPLINIPKALQKQGYDWLYSNGMPENTWFVTFHARENGNRPQDRDHEYRNVDIETYLQAMNYVIDKGGWCVRLGEPCMKPLRPQTGIIDYADHPDRNDWLDVFFCACARFLVSGNSGICNVATSFGTPVAIANMAPTSTMPVSINDVAIPKLLWHNKLKKFLSWREIFTTPLGNAYNWTRHHNEFREEGIQFIPDTAEEIRELTLEMNERNNISNYYTENDEELQVKYKSHFKAEQHYGTYSAARIGRGFLRKHKDLI